ncbi:MAG: SpoIIE family protein phosphatase [Candidatus Eisenbacteria bacterium]|nr:SpoIIE family protein phosphatase [Candidatus Eisenbacteria bacterium]
MALWKRSWPSPLAALGLLTVSLQILSLEPIIHRPDLGFTARSGRIQVVEPGGPAHRAGLRSGDRILQIDGRRVGPYRSAADLLQDSEGVEHTLVISRNGVRRHAVYRTGPAAERETHWRLAVAAVGLGTLLTGLIVHIKKKRPVTATFFGICYALGFLLLPPQVPHGDIMLLVRHIITDLVSAFMPALFVHFFLLFPARRPVLERAPLLPWILYLPSFLLWSLEQGLYLAHWQLALELHDLYSGLEIAGAVLFLVGAAVSIALFAQAFHRMRVASLRRRIHVTFVGTLAGITPTLIVLVLHMIFPGQSIPGDRLAVVALIFIPASFGYAIVRHGVFEIDQLVRRSLAVILLTALLVLIYFALYAFFRGPLHSVTAARGLTPSLLALLLILLVFSPARGRLQRVLDQELSVRSAPDRAVRELGRHLRTLVRREDLVRELVDALLERLSARAAYYFHPDPLGDGLRLDYACGIPLARLGRLSLSKRLLTAVHSLGGPVLREDLDAELPFGWLEDRDRQTLERLEVEVLAALPGKDEPLGLLLIGPRTSGGRFENWQLDFLDELLFPAAVALQNAVLHQETLREERWQHDLRVARSIQSGLLPRRLPRLPNFELYGETVSSQAVGGDYYDFLLPTPGYLVLGVGDVSGKGVPGALLMAHLQAIFRAEACQHWRSPAALLRQINRRICEIRRPDRFISLFCATVDLTARKVSYASAGHPPALLMQRDGTLQRLDLSGLLLGIQPDVTYPEGRAALAAGDLLLGYSDGAIEREGPTGQLGEEGLAAALARHRQLSARDLLQRLFAEIRYASASPLQDDTTLLLLKAL